MDMKNSALIAEVAVNSETVNTLLNRIGNDSIRLSARQGSLTAMAEPVARPNMGMKQGHPEKSELKIVVAGNVGSGKSTSIRAISEIPVISTETKATETDALHRKETTTTAIDYGVAYIENTKLHIYGAPGQRRFDFMSDILCKGASGMVVMIDNGCLDPLTEIDYYLNQHGNFLQSSSGVIAITHFDDNNTQTSLLDYHTYILKNGFTCPVMLLDARNKHEVEKVMLRLLLQIRGAKSGKI
ncbi:ATP/GTP-binding protein [Methylomicrobium lacus]|uniref:GTP-binding protein n=1 Tax=Methylomicrobium lacus TaxID=136992 RepID=UPI0035A97F1F